MQRTENGVRRWCGRSVQYAAIIGSNLFPKLRTSGKVERLEEEI